MKTDREKQIEKFINNYKTQEEWEEERHQTIKKLLDKYEKELDDYNYIGDLNKYEKIKNGGYIRYFNTNNELKWGGVLIKKIISEKKDIKLHLMVLMNSSGERNVVSFEKNIIFYKKHMTAGDKTRKLFMSYLEYDTYE